jgi:predicted O-methyltransferase YrrM
MDELRLLLEELEQDPSLSEAHRLRQRVDAIDRLESYGMDAHDEAKPASPAAAELRQRAKALHARLEADNQRLYRDIRRDVRQADGVGRLLPWLARISESGRTIELPDDERYDYLDDLVSGVLKLQEPDPGIVELGGEMVFYQPTPARHVFDLIERAGFNEDDVLVDLGSGLGHVSLLISLCTPATAIGIELQPAYVRCARASAAALNQTRVRFVQQDARMADLSTCTFVYLYTPFTGTILRSVLDSLKCEAAQRPIRIGAFGPCVLTLAQESWLEILGTIEPHRVALFRSRS